MAVKQNRLIKIRTEYPTDQNRMDDYRDMRQTRELITDVSPATPIFGPKYVVVTGEKR